MSVKKRLETALPLSSNLSKREQMFFIWQTVTSFNGFQLRSIDLMGKGFCGLFNEKERIGFFLRCRAGQRFEKIDIGVKKIAIGPEACKFILSSLRKLPLNRYFVFHCPEDREVIVEDTIMHESFPVLRPFASTKNFKVKVESSFLYFFRLNEKTVNKHTVCYLTDSFLVVEYKRKGSEMLFLYPAEI